MGEELLSLLQNITLHENLRNDNLKKSLDLIIKESIEIDQTTADVLISLLKKDVDACLLNVIADILKNEANRKFFIHKDTINIFVSNIGCDDENVSLQSLRCICNAAADNESVANIFIACDGVNLLLSKANQILQDEKEDNKFNVVIQPACSCIQNLISESSSLQEQFIDKKTLDTLWQFIEKFKEKNEEIACTCASGIASLIEDSELGLEKLNKSGILKQMLSQLKNSNNKLNEYMLHEILLELGKKEQSREILCDNGCIEVLFECIESSDEFNKNSSDDKYFKDLADLLTLLTSGDESFTKVVQNNKTLLKHFSSWLESKNTYIQTTAGLSLGNYARSEETCKDLVSHGIHENLMNIIKENVKNEEYADRIQAYASCLRNLCVAEPNKAILYSSGLQNVAVDIVLHTPFMVQFKGLAILRLLSQGNSELSSSLCQNNDFLEKAVEIANRPMVTPVPYESQRCLASIAKYGAENADALKNWLNMKCLGCMSFLLSSDHLIMKNEGLIAIIMIIVNLTDSLGQLQETDCIEKTFKLLNSTGSEQAQTLYNGLTLVQAIYSVEGGKDVLIQNNIQQVLENLKTHQEDVIRNKASETESLIS